MVNINSIVAFTLEGRYLSAEDSDFVQCVASDVGFFLKSTPKKRVLLFPPINSYHRFLIHKAIEEDFQGLVTFSIGQGDKRQTVVCLEELVFEHIQMEKDVSPVGSPSRPKGRGRGRSRQSTNSPQGATRKSKSSLDERQYSSRWNNDDGMYSDKLGQRYEDNGEINARNNSPPVMAMEGKDRVKGRKPAAQVYVPRARRLSDDPKDTSLHCSTKKPQEGQQENPIEDKNQAGRRKTRPAAGIYVPRAKRLQIEAVQQHGASTEADPSLSTEFVATEVSDMVEEKEHKSERRRSEGNSEKKNQRRKRTKSKEFEKVTNEGDIASNRDDFTTIPARLQKNHEESDDIRDIQKEVSDSKVMESIESCLPECKNNVAFEDLPSDDISRQEQTQFPAFEATNTESNNTALDENCSLVEEVNIIDDTSGDTSHPDEGITLNPKNSVIEGDKELKDCDEEQLPVIPGQISTETTPDSHINTNDMDTDSQKNDVPVCSENNPQVQCDLGDSFTLDNSQKLDCDSKNTSAKQDTPKLAQKEKTSVVDEKTVDDISPNGEKKSSKKGKDIKLSKSADAETKKSSKQDKNVDSSKKGDEDIPGAKPVDNSKMDEQKLLKMGMIVGPDDTEHDMKSKKKKQQKKKLQEIKAKSQETEEAIGNACDTADKKGEGESMEVEDSWDDMFDDDGEALAPNMLEELTAAVGKVSVQKTQFDYYNFQPKDPDMDLSEYNHLIEISEFPKDFLTRDLIIAFREYQDRGFDIKWVDDTHAIGIFASSIAAQSALQMKHPMIKVKSISEATRATKLKAKKSTEFLQPYKERPETTAAIARNLVAGALGMTGRVCKEKRDEDRKKLREAREKKKQASKDKRNVWEGVVGKCAMDDM